MLLGLVIGLVLISGAGVLAATYFDAIDITFTPNDENWEVTNVKDAIDELYNLSNKDTLESPVIITSMLYGRIPEEVSTGTDSISVGTVGNNVATLSTTDGYRVYSYNANTYSGGSNEITTRKYYTFGRTYMQLYISKYQHQAGNGNYGDATLTVYGYNSETDTSTVITEYNSQSLKTGWFTYDVSEYSQVYLKMTSGANDRYSTGTAGIGELIIQQIKMVNEI